MQAAGAPFGSKEYFLFWVQYYYFHCPPGLGKLPKLSFFPGWRFSSGLLLFLGGSQFGFPHGPLLHLVSQKAFTAKIALQ